MPTSKRFTSHPIRAWRAWLEPDVASDSGATQPHREAAISVPFLRYIPKVCAGLKWLFTKVLSSGRADLDTPRAPLYALVNMPGATSIRTQPKGSRAGGYHVKTGCITCKIRHVKCDEEKPACLKCRNTGRTCDGYLCNTKRRTPPDLTLGQHVHARQLSIATSLSPSISGSTQERQCFEYFRFEIGQELSTAIMLETTHLFVLQACHFDDAIRSAVIALGSMGHRLRVNRLLTSENTQANALQDFAQFQYYKALKHLRAQMCNEPTRTIDLAIISCFLFTIFEFLQGNDTGALVHLRSGLNILRRENGTGGATLGQDFLRQEITRIFSIMDMSATMWLGLKSLQSPAIMPLGGLGPAPLSLNHFLNIEEAAASLNYQITRIYHSRRWVNFYSNLPENYPPNSYARHQDLMAELERWPTAMDSFLDTLDEAALGVDLLHRASVMRMNYQITIIQNTLCIERSDEKRIRCRYEKEFLQIISVARSIIIPMDDVTRSRVESIVAANNRGINPVPLFSLYAGIIHPLFIVAVNSKNMSVAQEAVSLLSTTPWREGAWDSAAMARIAEKKIRQLQAEGYYDDGLGSDSDLYVDMPVRSPYDEASLGSPSPPTTEYPLR